MSDTKKSLIRLPMPLYAHIENSAKASLRSINSEMVALLKMGLVYKQKSADMLSAADEYLAKEEF